MTVGRLPSTQRWWRPARWCRSVSASTTTARGSGHSSTSWAVHRCPALTALSSISHLTLTCSCGCRLIHQRAPNPHLPRKGWRSRRCLRVRVETHLLAAGWLLQLNGHCGTAGGVEEVQAVGFQPADSLSADRLKHLATSEGVCSKLMLPPPAMHSGGGGGGGAIVRRAGYSAVEPSTWIRPHHGETNTQLKLHFGLTVPTNSTGQVRAVRWQLKHKCLPWGSGRADPRFSGLCTAGLCTAPCRRGGRRRRGGGRGVARVDGGRRAAVRRLVQS